MRSTLHTLAHCAGVLLALAVAGSLAAQQPQEECGPSVGPGTRVPAGWHAHEHDGHYHLCRPLQQPRVQQQAPPQQPNPAAVAFLQQRLQKAQEDYRSCVELRSGMTSGVMRATTSCEGWLTTIRQLQADIRRAQGW